MEHVQERRTAKRICVTQLQYYAYRLAIRSEFSLLHISGKLFQQFIVDVYVRTEGSRLNYLRLNQKDLRVELYQGLLNSLQSEAHSNNVKLGKLIILPSPFQGSPRSMQQNYQDGMAIVRKFGRPDIFLTFTCNPAWPEIVSALQRHQRPENRPNIIVRVLKLKLTELLDDILNVMYLEGLCSKNFPKGFQETTQENVNGYPVYQRSITKPIKVGKYDIDNRWVVPYNPWLSRKFNAHINVEICASVKSVKYLYKYVYKGHDAAYIKLQLNDDANHDEILTFLDGRYVIAPEAMWWLNEFHMSEKSHTVMRLAVHLPNQQQVIYQSGHVVEVVCSSLRQTYDFNSMVSIKPN
ncbi:uncharacterized protein [Parasteatoda tepidariorum]|uniref:uncharacterized protein n=1 Tax=Parasteatoda tepidariorum TaxID=114398 RepID=UPI0039BCA514